MNDNVNIDVKLEASAKAEVSADLTNLIDESVTPTAAKMGSTISSLWEHIFGPVILSGQKKELKRLHDLQLFEESLIRNKEMIPEERLQEPKLSVVGPALEASKYYYEEPVLREMFAKLVSSSLDSSKNEKIHESYVEIIKQLSNIDAKHLIQIHNSKVNPIINLKRKSKDGLGFTHVATNLYLSQHVYLESHELISASLVNLKRLGLIDISDDSSYTNDVVYEDLLNHPYVELKLNLSNGTITADKGLIEITSFGRQFCQICF